MKIFGIGLQKTGTTTLGSCLKILGYKHMTYNNEAIVMLREKKLVDLHSIIRKYDSFEDEPWAHSYKHLYSWYPNAKFILTIRKDSEIWFRSMYYHCQRIKYNQHRRYFFGFEVPFGNKDNYIAKYEKHNKEVMNFFKDKKSQLLVVCWENGDSWEKLCPFLDKAIPKRNFPHSNKKPFYNIEFIKRIRSEIGKFVRKLLVNKNN